MRDKEWIKYQSEVVENFTDVLTDPENPKKVI